MSFTFDQVRPLLTQAELELFEVSMAQAGKRPSGSELTNTIHRAREMRDKYHDLYRRQTVHTKKGGDARHDDGNENQRTHEKSQIMNEVLERLEAMRQD